jgi:hypothetical protein
MGDTDELHCGLEFGFEDYIYIYFFFLVLLSELNLAIEFTNDEEGFRKEEKERKNMSEILFERERWGCCGILKDEKKKREREREI